MAADQSDKIASAIDRLAAATIEVAMRRGGDFALDQQGDLLKGRPAALGNSRYLDWARKVYRVRRLRSKHLPDIFGEPAWDIVLDLYIAFMEGRKVSTKSACISADCPTATALRKIADLEAAGVVFRVEDLKDRRLKWIGISKEAIWAMNHLCEEAMGDGSRGKF